MRYRALLLMLLLSMAEAIGQTTYKTTADPCLNLRDEARTSATTVACLDLGTTVIEIDSIPYWRRIETVSGEKGWVAKRYLTLADSPSPGPAAGVPANAWLEVHFVDVGQGDGIWIHTHDDGIDGNGIFEGKNIVIDGGPDRSDAKNEMLQYLMARAYPQATIDALIVTHPHNDHYPGAIGILRQFEVRDYYDPGYPKEGSDYQAFLDLVRHETAGGQPTRVMLGKNSFALPEWGSEVQAEYLYAYPGSPAGLGSGNTVENNASIVLRLQYGNHVFLFMGDAEGKDRADSPATPKYAEKILLDTKRDRLKATVLKIAHHGSETSSTLPFIEAVDPDIVVVQSGRKSFSGTYLPDASTLRRYCCHKPSTLIFRTDEKDAAEGRTTTTDADGDHIVIRTNGRDLQVIALEAGQPYTVNACRPGCN